MDEFVTLDSVFAGDIFSHFKHLVLKVLSPKKNAIIFAKIVTFMMNWQQDFVSSNSVCNHTHE